MRYNVNAVERLLSLRRPWPRGRGFALLRSLADDIPLWLDKLDQFMYDINAVERLFSCGGPGREAGVSRFYGLLRTTSHHRAPSILPACSFTGSMSVTFLWIRRWCVFARGPDAGRTSPEPHTSCSKESSRLRVRSSCTASRTLLTILAVWASVRYLNRWVPQAMVSGLFRF